MRCKTLVALLLFVAAIGIVVMATPASAASAGDSVTKDGPGGYKITFIKSSPSLQSSQGMVQPMVVWNSIGQGQYKWHNRNINYYTTSAEFYLYWGNPSNTLRLRLFTPDGYVLGPFYDSVDGSINGATGVRISRDGGLAQGTWYEEIFGERVSGTQSYYI